MSGILFASEKDEMRGLNDAQLRAIIREDDRRERGGVFRHPRAKAEAAEARLILKQRKGGKP